MRRTVLVQMVLAAALLPLLTACGGYSGGANDAPLMPVTFQAPVGGLAASEEVAAFSSTVYPIVRDHCLDCHAGSGPGTPHIAHSDAATAYSWEIRDDTARGHSSGIWFEPVRANSRDLETRGDDSDG